MSCKSALYCANTNNQTMAIGGVIGFGSVVRKYGCNCALSGGNIQVQGSGYYDLDTNITLTAGTAGTAVITLYKDGTAIPGAEASLTVAADGIYQVSIPAVIRDICGCESTITAVLTGVAGTVNNAAAVIEKI